MFQFCELDSFKTALAHIWNTPEKEKVYPTQVRLISDAFAKHEIELCEYGGDEEQFMREVGLLFEVMNEDMRFKLLISMVSGLAEGQQKHSTLIQQNSDALQKHEEKTQNQFEEMLARLQKAEETITILQKTTRELTKWKAEEKLRTFSRYWREIQGRPSTDEKSYHSFKSFLEKEYGVDGTWIRVCLDDYALPIGRMEEGAELGGGQGALQFIGNYASKNKIAEKLLQLYACFTLKAEEAQNKAAIGVLPSMAQNLCMHALTLPNIAKEIGADAADTEMQAAVKVHHWLAKRDVGFFRRRDVPGQSISTQYREAEARLDQAVLYA
ncbi:unnamed protein product [Amoebophrya sp. A120]|nr:unnamed protein product [Amoebophrya sp. A120]|eukprot:GSA120T00020854001.1